MKENCVTSNNKEILLELIKRTEVDLKENYNVGTVDPELIPTIAFSFLDQVLNEAGGGWKILVGKDGKTGDMLLSRESTFLHGYDDVIKLKK